VRRRCVGGANALAGCSGRAGGASALIHRHLRRQTVALSPIQRSLHFSSADLAWVIDAYTLTFGGLLLLGGRAGDVFGRRRMLMIGLSIFTAASLAGGLAPSPNWLLAARALQGVGAAMASPSTLSLISALYEEGAPQPSAFHLYGRERWRRLPRGAC
jgi:MFS family permease